MSTVWFMVDDTDPRLNYSGSWSFIPKTNNFSANSFDESSTTGPAFNSTLHSTTSNVTISFRFNGSSYLGVYGTEDGTHLNGVLPDISCLLDGEPTWTFTRQYPGGHTNNNMLACRADSRIGGSSPGEHELLINVTNYPTSTWYFDYITFESLADPVLDGEVLQAGNAELIDATNYSMLSFGPGWSINPDDSSVTSIPGSTASMKFNGTSISLYGDLLSNVSNTASYQVDGRDPVTVQMPGGIGSTTSSKYPLFTASDLSVGEHTLVLAFNGSKSGMPLDVNYFYVQSLTSAQQASPISPPPAPSKHSNRGVVLGAVLGSVIPVVLLLVLAAAWFWRRSRRKKAQRLITPFRQYEHDLVTTPLTNHDIINASSYQFGDTYSSSPPTKKEQNDVILAALRGGDSSQYPDSSGSGTGTGSGGRDEIPSSNLMTLKLGQRLADQSTGSTAG